MSSESNRSEIDVAKRAQFEVLFGEFLESYPATEGGQQHIEVYEPSRQRGRENFEKIVAAADQGDDITEMVLFKLIPYTDTADNRKSGRWVHIAPVCTTDIRKKFEGAGWTKPDDWPRIAKAILDFIRRCSRDSNELPAACEEFASLPYSTGFQTGTLTPILNALHPDRFLLINNKSRNTINYFASTSHGQKLREYPETNTTGWALIQELAPVMHRFDIPDLRDSDLFDVFSHWLVAVKDFSFRPIRYWKIAPGENAWNWDACRDGGFIAIGWDGLGDISGLSRSEFDARRDELVAQHDNWTKAGANQVWRFARIVEGDRVVTNHGTSEVLGIGRVVGPYYFVEGQRHGHRLPVEWDDATRRRVDEYGWRRTLVELDREKFKTILKTPPIEIDTDLAAPFSKIFEDREEAEWAFDLLNETLQRLGVTNAADERFSVTLRHSERVLRLNFGNWAVLQFHAPSYSSYKVGMALIEGQVDIEGTFARWGDPFDQNEIEPTIRIYGLPIETVRPLEGKLRKVYENTFAHIAERFKHWQASPYRKYGVPEIWTAIFDPDKRSDLLNYGPMVPVPPPEIGYFTSRTFDLLEDLHENPVKSYYMEHRQAFETHLLEPFKRLFHDVAERLPPAITEVMETKRWLFSRIPKNDFGQGGAWNFYWGAFYPKGSKRIQDAQLSLVINYERMEFGFYIADYATERRQRFLRRCREHHSALQTILQDVLSSDDIVFGSQEDIVIKPDGTVESQLGLTWQEWLQHPDQADFDVSVVLPRDEVLAYSEDELSCRIAQTYEQLFPLVLLASEDDPLAAIAEYLDNSDEKSEPNPVYPIAQCAKETFFDESTITRWVRAIERKKQAILYGPPGTGKTYLAEHLAKHLIGGQDGFSEVVQFHPAYAYEDFVQGLRPDPDADGGLRFNRAPGRFLEFCRKARACDGHCVLIIDEINRANLSRVFGELMYLLEYRDRAVPLAAGGRFSIPENVRIIGTMNTADRSIALVDHALRRRFAFLALYPDYDVLRRYHSVRQTGFDVEPLIQVLKQLNRQIDDRHYAVGITFFLLPELSRHIEDIWRVEIEPYLEEYFFDQTGKVEQFRWKEIKDKIIP